eukprot:75029_1
MGNSAETESTMDQLHLDQDKPTKGTSVNNPSVTIPVKRSGGCMNCRNEQFSIICEYSSSTKINDVFYAAMKKLNNRCYPRTHHVTEVQKESFIAKQIEDDYWNTPKYNAECAKPITDYKIQDIQEKGLIISVRVAFTHRVIAKEINCPHITKFMKNKIGR